jgi:hypothetical protein
MATKENKGIIYLKGFKNESLENVIDYWVLMNRNQVKIELLTVTDNPVILHAINLIKKELNKEAIS